MDSPPQFEPLGTARFRVEHHQGVERIVIPAQRRWFIMAFLGVWLTFWTFAGIDVVLNLFAEFNLFMLVWMVFWAIGWFFAASMLNWQIGGKSIVWVEQGALAHRWQMPLFTDTKFYAAGEVKDLRAKASENGLAWTGRSRLVLPPFFPMQEGAVRFDYGQRAESFGVGLDEVEGQQIVDWLTPRLPRV